MTLVSFCGVLFWQFTDISQRILKNLCLFWNWNWVCVWVCVSLLTKPLTQCFTNMFKQIVYTWECMCALHPYVSCTSPILLQNHKADMNIALLPGCVCMQSSAACVFSTLELHLLLLLLLLLLAALLLWALRGSAVLGLCETHSTGVLCGFDYEVLWNAVIILDNFRLLLTTVAMTVVE